MPKLKQILIVEDNPSDRWIIETAIRQHGISAQIQMLGDGEQALLYLAEAVGEEARATLDLLILDLNLPKYSGDQVMRQWRASRLAEVPIMIVSSSDSAADRKLAEAPDSYYFQKPMDIDEFMEIGTLMRQILGKSEPIEEAEGSQ